MSNIAIVGGGIAGLSAAYHLSKNGHLVTVFEADPELGGLAGSFTVGASRLEKFYHHWFTSDHEIISIIDELDLNEYIDEVDSNTAVFVGNSFFKLSNPKDLLKFSPLSFFNRLRLGIVSLWIKSVKDWKRLEAYTAAEWLQGVYGQKIFEVLWRPLLRGKFGPHWETISAVWMWNKLKLRGGSRKRGSEKLLYLKGGFEVLIKRLAYMIESFGGSIILNSPVSKLYKDSSGKYNISIKDHELKFDEVILTTPLPTVADICELVLDNSTKNALRKFKYLSNVCVVLESKKSLTEHYWVNVNDPEFPFVAIIEHTNFQSKNDYNGNHLIYLSKYCDPKDEMYLMSNSAVIDFTKSCLKKMFSDFDSKNIIESYVWRADYSQPIVEKNYSYMLNEINQLPDGLHIASMALIYPEDRGTNYAFRQGRCLAENIIKSATKGQNFG